MSSVLEQLHELATTVARALPESDALLQLSATEETEAMRMLGSIRSRVDATISLLASDIQRRSARELGTEGLAQRNGFTDGAGFVQKLIGTDRAEASRLIRVGGLLETAQTLAPAEEPTPPERSIDYLAALPGGWDAPLAVALQHGWVSAAHADALRRCLGAPRTEELRAAWRDAALELIGDCWSGQWCPEDLARAAKRARACLDTVAAQADARHRYEARSFRRFVRPTGMVHYDLELDPESDTRFWEPIKTLLSPRLGGPRFRDEAQIAATELEEDPRSNEQLQLDTLLDLIDRGVNTSGKELFKTVTPQVTIAVTTAELNKARHAEELLHRHHAGDHTGCDPAGSGSTGDRPSAPTSCPGPDAGIAWLDGRDEPVTALDAQRMICTGTATPLLFDHAGQTLNLGAEHRYFTTRQKRAMAHRDGGCLYPGCDRPPTDCEGHHINPWAQHPSHHKTEVRDGVLLCRRHHKMIHDHGGRIERHDSTYRLHWPGKHVVQLHPKAGIQTQLRTQRRTA